MSTDKITKSLYGGEIIVDFLPNSHRYKINGKSGCISVTTATGIIDCSRPLLIWASRLTKEYLEKYLNDCNKSEFSYTELLPAISEACRQHEIKRDAAATIGTTVHDWAEAFANAKAYDLEIPSLPSKVEGLTFDEVENVANGISAFLDWNNAHDVEYLAVEEIIYSRAHDYTGKFDVFAKVDGKKTIIDYKTGSGIYSGHRYQLSAYWQAYEEEYGVGIIEQAMIAHFNKKTGNFDTLIINRDEHQEKNLPAFLACLAVKRREKELDVWEK